MRVIVSVLPMKTFVEKIGGKHVDVRVMVKPGYSPQTYDPTSQQLTALSNADLYVRIGVPFEQAWMERIRSANREMQVLDAHAGIELRVQEAHDHGDGQAGVSADGSGEQGRRGARETDLHVWTDPILVKQIAGAIGDKLAELDPGNAQNYRRNYELFAAELDALDRDIRSLLGREPGRKFMVFHPAWGYFASAYGLIQVPIEKEGKEPGPRALAALIEQARREQVEVIFVQPQFSRKLAEQVARAIGGRVLAVDPLAADYVGNLRRVAQQIAGAVRK